MEQLQPIAWNQVEITGGFWARRIERNRTVTLQAEYEQCRSTGRLDSIKCLYDAEKDHREHNGVFTIDGVLSDNLAEEGIPRPHHYWDSDIAKWMEAAAYSLTEHPDPELEQTLDAIVEDFFNLQQPDGYLNTYYTVVEPGKRLTNVCQMHELYCAGHLIEAAVAYYQATGKDRFLQILCRYADFIDRTFGPNPDQIHGYPGHQEIELALVKLYRVTGEQRYLNLATYFLNQRGKQPFFFDEEAQKTGRDTEEAGPKGILSRSFLNAGPYALFQSHLPLREQKTAEGHAVRVTYMGAGAAAAALENGDESLLAASKTLWNNVVNRRMYITGGIGSQDGCERFNFDYQLPNESAYNETCAAIGMVFWGHSLLQTEPNGRYGDSMERALYNGVISGVSLQGDRFFYANHLASHPGVYEDGIVKNPRMFPERQSWFPVSCCPMNLTRLTASIGGYAYSRTDDCIYTHLYLDSAVTIPCGGTTVHLRQTTGYPFDEKIHLTVETDQPATFTLALRVPGWCNQPSLEINGQSVDCSGLIKNGYLYLTRRFSNDQLLWTLPMQPTLMEANPAVRMDCGKAAIQRGPIVYCLEEIDNGKNLFDICISADTELTSNWEPDLLDGVVTITATAKRRSEKEWKDILYRPVRQDNETIPLKAIPYYAWSNRSVGEMTVWIGLD